MGNTTLLWVGFGLFVLTVLATDLGILNRQARHVNLREAATWTAIWVSLALIFNVAVYFLRGRVAALEFFTGYLIEWSLSMDNVFVFALLFAYFAVPRRYQRRVLFWGILGAVVMRLTFILIGVALLKKFHWVIYIFGAIVFLAGVKMFRHGTEDIHPERNPVLNLARRFLRITPTFEKERFFVRHNGALFATPLLLVLLVVEATDVVFAVDSIPAIFAITRDPFIVFTSNVFAILGLRALYFLLAGVIGMFRYLDEGLALVLCFIGVKMLLSDTYHISVGWSLGVVVMILTVAIIVSLVAAKSEKPSHPPKRQGASDGDPGSAVSRVTPTDGKAHRDDGEIHPSQ
ncbi:MAG: TerC family protein [Abditibacteriales bacterium]|nr:TerC family protein [Abditibacteriales bacterium]MDW8366435.1 TerC family protein [Abditibacteriales bacterium]